MPVMVNDPVNAAADRGLNTRLMVQVELPARVAPQVPPALPVGRAKALAPPGDDCATTMLPIVRAVEAALVRVTVNTALVPPTATWPNDNGVPGMLAPAPDPVSATGELATMPPVAVMVADPV